MYNLLMVGSAGYWEERTTADYEWSRFLEHTQEALRSRFLPATDETVAELMQLPALFAYEFSTNAAIRLREGGSMARLGTLAEIRRRHGEIQFRYEFSPDVDPIPMERIAELAWDLDINVKGNENYRTHWAVKDVDLFAVLRRSGIITQTHPVAPDIARQLKELTAEPPTGAAVRPKVFIVHGRDAGIKNEVARWISRIGLEDVILHEQPNGGRTLISKFREIAEGAVFAIVIMTPDDVGGLAGGSQARRARQNVIFELGYFLGKLGPQRVVALVVGDGIEKPSDYDGVVYISYDERGAWKLDLAREFSSLGIPFAVDRTW